MVYKTDGQIKCRQCKGLMKWVENIRYEVNRVKSSHIKAVQRLNNVYMYVIEARKYDNSASLRITYPVCSKAWHSWYNHPKQ